MSLLVLILGLQLLLIALLGKMAYRDFTTQKLGNDDVLAVLALSLSTMACAWFAGADGWRLGLALAAALLLFLLLFPFWLLGKVGAGDVKFMATAPLVTGGGDLLLFALALLVAAALTAFVVRNPVLLPEGVFRHYIQFLDRKRVVPFGVPISAALIVVLLFQIARAGWAMT